MKRLFFTLALLLCAVPSFCCTSVIISGRATSDGRPLMLKNRDTDELNNRMEYFRGPLYTFIGLVDSPSEGGEVWSGLNEAGFAIINTASYNMKYDDVPRSEMSREGQVMYRALGECKTLKDFELLLDALPRPIGVQTNFGVIDAFGGAAYYEVDNTSWVKYDVNESETGYRVVTNFSTRGRQEDVRGYERYLTASDVMSELRSSGKSWNSLNHSDLFNSLSRSYRHTLTGFDFARDWKTLTRKTSFTGVGIDQDFIPRISTSASVVIEGVAAGENPAHGVMWTILGYPACSVALPMMVTDSDRLPSCVKKTESGVNSQLCDAALKIKSDYVFTFKVSSGEKYLRLDNILKGAGETPSLLSCCAKAEKQINSSFYELYRRWTRGEMSDSDFYDSYAALTETYFDVYKSCFSAFML